MKRYTEAKFELFGENCDRAIYPLTDYRRPCEICGKAIVGKLHPRQKYCKSCRKAARNEYERAFRLGRRVMEERLEAFKVVFIQRFEGAVTQEIVV